MSTDYEVPDPRFGPYVVRIPGGTPARCNPVTAPPSCQLDRRREPAVPCNRNKMSHATLIEAYFDAIRARDAAGLASLFSADAELVTAAGTFLGREAIAGFYRDLAFLVEDL